MTSIALAFLGIGSLYISCVFGFVYPAFMSVLALERNTKGEDKQWLTYWVLFGFLNFTDHIAGSVLTKIPFYYFIKLISLVWLYHPNMLGATRLYNMFI